MTEEVYPKQAVIYLRPVRSDQDSRARSIARQRRGCQRRAAELGLEVVKEFMDEPNQGRDSLIKLISWTIYNPGAYVISERQRIIGGNMYFYTSVIWAIEKSGCRLEIASLPHQETETARQSPIGQIAARQLDSSK